jgi:hypothetical protein
LEAYVETLQERVSPVSVWGYVRSISVFLQVADAEGDRTLIKGVVQKLKRRAQPKRDTRDRLVAPSHIYSAAIRRMERCIPEALASPKCALSFGDGLMLAIGISKPIRRKNSVDTTINCNLKKTSSGCYHLSFSAQETKTSVPIEADLPQRLTPYIDFWLEKVRPFLLNGRRSDKFWLAGDGTDLSPSQFYTRHCNASLEEVGRRINPHLMRAVVTTGIAVAAPEMIMITPQLLDHRDERTTRDAYNLAQQLTASKSYISILSKWRYSISVKKRLLGPSSSTF